MRTITVQIDMQDGTQYTYVCFAQPRFDGDEVWFLTRFGTVRLFTKDIKGILKKTI